MSDKKKSKGYNRTSATFETDQLYNTISKRLNTKKEVLHWSFERQKDDNISVLMYFDDNKCYEVKINPRNLYDVRGAIEQIDRYFYLKGSLS